MFQAPTANRRATFAAAVGLALALGAACEDDPCANVACAESVCVPPFTLGVTDEATGGSVSGVSVTAAGLTCAAPAVGVVTCAAGAAATTWAIEVSAPGYRARQVDVVVDPAPPPGECCPACQTWHPTSVALTACGTGCPILECRPPFVLIVGDAATGQAVVGAAAASPGLACFGGYGLVGCDVAGAAGTYAVTVSAPGYASREISVTVEPPPEEPACGCPACQGWLPTSVVLAHSSR
jgi:hypothetical protein